MVSTSKFFIKEHQGGWASFQSWVKKWNRIMSIVFSALVVLLLIAVVIVNTLDAHEDAQKYAEEIQQNKKKLTNRLVTSCFWDNVDNCYLDCMSGTSNSLNDELEVFWNQRPECHNAGFKLRIGSSITFPNYIMPAKWLTANVSISELLFDFRNFDTVEANAFATAAFNTVQTMTITSAGMRTLEVNTLNGLHSLRALTFSMSSIRVFATGVLDNFAGTLENLTLIEWSSFSSPLLADGLTGGAQMTALKRVRLNYNFDKTITQRTFVGLTYVTHLDLSYCKIQTIGMNAFDAISNTIQELNLSENKLTTFAAGLFDLIIPRTGVHILIDTNAWECDCQLCYFKWMLLNSDMFVQSSSPECRTPSTLRYAPVKSTHFCFEFDCDSYTLSQTTLGSITASDPGNAVTTQQITTGSLNNTSEITPTSAYVTDSSTSDNSLITQNEESDETNLVPLTCFTLNAGEKTYENIYISHISSGLKIFEIQAGEVIVTFETVFTYSTLLWYNSDGYNHSLTDGKSLLNQSVSVPMQCTVVSYAANDGSQRLRITNLTTNKAYIFCLVDIEHVAMSPLNCIPHFVAAEPTDKTGWIDTDHRELLIGIIVLCITVSVLLGMILGYVVLQRNPGLLSGSKHVTMVTSTAAISDPKSDCTNNMSHQVYGSNVQAISVDQSYVTASTMSPFERLQYKLDKNQENQYYMDGMPYVLAPIPPSVQKSPVLSVKSVPPLPYTISSNIYDYDDDDEPDDHYSTVGHRK